MPAIEGLIYTLGANSFDGGKQRRVSGRGSSQFHCAVYIVRLLSRVSSFVSLPCFLVTEAMNRHSRLIKIVLSILVLYALYLTIDRWRYEKPLNSLYITLDDFPRDYSRALTAMPNETLVKQYDFSTFPNRNLDFTIPP